jgi:hypothetical protein
MKTISENPGYEKCDECEMSTTLYTDDFKEYAVLPCKCKVLCDLAKEVEQLTKENRLLKTGQAIHAAHEDAMFDVGVQCDNCNKEYPLRRVEFSMRGDECVYWTCPDCGTHSVSCMYIPKCAVPPAPRPKLVSHEQTVTETRTGFTVNIQDKYHVEKPAPKKEEK